MISTASVDGLVIYPPIIYTYENKNVIMPEFEAKVGKEQIEFFFNIWSDSQFLLAK